MSDDAPLPPMLPDLASKLWRAVCGVMDEDTRDRLVIAGERFEHGSVLSGNQQYQFRTIPRRAEALRSLAGTKDASPPSFSGLEMLALSAIAYQQPVTRADLYRLAGHDISRDILGRLESISVIELGPRAPELGAPIAQVTTQGFLEALALGSLRELPDLDTLDVPATQQREHDEKVEAALDDAFGLDDEEPAEAEDGEGHNSDFGP